MHDNHTVFLVWVAKYDDGESLYDCAVREVCEETGLVVRNLKSCGLVHWYNNKTADRMMIFLYKTSDFEGEILSNDEGKNFWMDITDLRSELNSGKQTNSFYVYQPLFFEDKYNEAFCSWNDDEPWEMRCSERCVVADSLYLESIKIARKNHGQLTAWAGFVKR
jgi:8-oxo-dGTP diphosphatase